jgi:hypothetical protein
MRYKFRQFVLLRPTWSKVHAAGSSECLCCCPRNISRSTARCWGLEGAQGLDEAVRVAPHIAQKQKSRTLDGRTTRHPGYAISQRARKRIEEVFGCMKTVGGLRKLRHRGGGQVNWQFLLAAAAYNLVRMRTLEATT